MSIKKQYIKGKDLCKVTFTLLKEAVKSAKRVYIVGEFNDWNIYATPMKKQKNGAFTVTLNLEKGREYQFRYLIDEMVWENDWHADRYAPTPFGDCDNSIVVV